MTREEALIQLRLGPGINEDVSEEYNEAVNMAIKALQQQPSEGEQIIKVSKGTLKARTGRFVVYDVKWLKEHFNTTEAKIYGQPSEDWNAVLDELIRIGRNAFKDDTDYDNLFDFISNLPNVKPQSKTGHWTHDGGYWKNRWICSECGYKLYDEQSKYCPDCGARMEAKE